MTRSYIVRSATIALAGLALGACASAKKPGYLSQAEGIYSALAARGGNETVGSVYFSGKYSYRHG